MTEQATWRAVFIHSGGEYGPEDEGWAIVSSDPTPVVLRVEGAVHEDDVPWRVAAESIAAVLNGWRQRWVGGVTLAELLDGNPERRATVEDAAILLGLPDPGDAYERDEDERILVVPALPSMDEVQQ